MILRRLKTPESTVCPRREMALKYIWPPLSTTLTLCFRKSGPSTRFVAGAGDGDADVAGGLGSLSQLAHALSARMAAATRLITPIREPANRVWSS